MSDSLYKLVNPEFDFEFAGTTYRLRKANLDKAVQYQQRVKELNEAKDTSADLKIAAFCIYIMLKDKNPNITEAFVMSEVPADIDPLDVMTMMGFINPKRMEMVKKLQEGIVGRLSSDVSSPISPSTPDGAPTKSEN